MIFEKRPGKYDALLVERNGALEEIACPRQASIPHDMLHFAVEMVLERRGFLRRVAAGEGAGFRMDKQADSEGVERLVETMQADSWSGRPDPDEVVELFLTTCAARSDQPFALTTADIVAIRAEIDRLAVAWAAVPERGRLELELT